jgi:hypothetical protein
MSSIIDASRAEGHKKCSCVYNFQTPEYLEMLKDETLNDIKFEPDFVFRTCFSCWDVYHPRTIRRYGGICHTCYDYEKLKN